MKARLMGTLCACHSFLGRSFFGLTLSSLTFLFGVTGQALAQTDASSVVLQVTLTSSPSPSIASPNGQSGQTSLNMSPPPTTNARLSRQQIMPGAVQRMRHIQYSEDQVVYVTLDDQGKELYRNVQIDPRLIRAEVPDTDGQLQSRAFYRPSAMMTFSVPNDSRNETVILYKPKWDGVSFTLVQIGTMLLR